MFYLINMLWWMIIYAFKFASASSLLCSGILRTGTYITFFSNLEIMFSAYWSSSIINYRLRGRYARILTLVPINRDNHENSLFGVHPSEYAVLYCSLFYTIHTDMCDHMDGTTLKHNAYNDIYSSSSFNDSR